MAGEGGRGPAARLLLDALVRWRRRVPRRPVDAALAGDHWPVTFVIHHVHGVGGTIRSTITQASWFAAAGHPVRVISVVGSTQPPFFAIPDEIEVLGLDDPQPRGRVQRVLRGTLRRVPSLLFHPQESRRGRMSLWRDMLLIRRLWREQGRVVVATRAGLNTAVALFAPRSSLTIGQEHVPFEDYPPALREELGITYVHLDALMVLTMADAATARALTGGRVAVEVVPNATPDGVVPEADLDATTIVAAGRLSRNKRHDVLLRAFAEVADDHPAWRLRLFGRGPREQRLRRMVADLGLESRVEFARVTDDLPRELARGSVFALTSDLEAFGIVLVEAMQAGMAIVSTACPHGPPELLTDGNDGLLVPRHDVDAVARGLEALLGDRCLRQRLGASARRTGRRYTASVVSERWLDVQQAAIDRRRTTPWHRPRRDPWRTSGTG